MKNILLKIIGGITFTLLGVTMVNAGFGVSPTDLNHEYLKPGSTFEKEFTISRSESFEEMDIVIEPTFEEISSWFTYYPSQSFKFEAGERTTSFKIIVNVPEGAGFKDYDGVFRVKATPSAQSVMGVAITQGVRLDSDLIVTQDDMRLLSVMSIKVLDSVIGENIKVEVIGHNGGNVDVTPSMHISVMDLNMNVLEEHDIYNFGFIKPNTTDTLVGEFDTNLPTGEYFIEVSVLLDSEVLRKDRLVFVINNIPEDVTETDDKDITTLIGSISSFVRDNGRLITYIGIAVVVFLLLYILLSERWSKKGIKKKTKEKWWAVLLGSKMFSRFLLSFFVALIGMLSLILGPIIINDSSDIDTQGETQGAYIIDSTLEVFTAVEVKEYIVYEVPNIDSRVIYRASENEEFKVIDEVNGWYQVEVNNGTIGWLEMDIVKGKSVR